MVPGRHPSLDATCFCIECEVVEHLGRADFLFLRCAAPATSQLESLDHVAQHTARHRTAKAARVTVELDHFAVGTVPVSRGIWTSITINISRVLYSRSGIRNARPGRSAALQRYGQAELSS